MRLPRILALTISLTAALALAVPALAETPPQGGTDVPAPPETDAENPLDGCRDLLPAPDEQGTDEETGEVTTAETDATDGTAFAVCVLETLTDVEGTTHAAAIVALVGEDFADGFPDATFRPEASISRAQMATMLTDALDLEASTSGELPDDVDPDSAHATAIAAILDAGISNGKADGTFGPNDPVSRGQMAAFLDNAGLIADLPDDVTVDLPDDVEGSVYEDAIAGLLGNGIASGFPDETFRPTGDVSRGHMATFITAALGLELPELPELS